LTEAFSVIVRRAGERIYRQTTALGKEVRDVRDVLDSSGRSSSQQTNQASFVPGYPLRRLPLSPTDLIEPGDPIDKIKFIKYSLL
jgi:hypothetical protein